MNIVHGNEQKWASETKCQASKYWGVDRKKTWKCMTCLPTIDVLVSWIQALGHACTLVPLILLKMTTSIIWEMFHSRFFILLSIMVMIKNRWLNHLTFSAITPLRMTTTCHIRQRNLVYAYACAISIYIYFHSLYKSIAIED